MKQIFAPPGRLARKGAGVGAPGAEKKSTSSGDVDSVNAFGIGAAFKQRFQKTRIGAIPGAFV